MAAERRASEELLVRSRADFLRVYETGMIEQAVLGYNNDKRFFTLAITATARIIGEHSLAQMRTIRRSLWNRYLHTSERGAIDTSTGTETGPLLTGGRGINSFARALACYLVYTTDAPFPALPEDNSLFERTPLGIPPEPNTMPLPGGIVTPDELDAGVVPPNTEGGPILPTRWLRWGQTANSNQRYAHYIVGDTDDNEIKRKLIDPEAGGHSFLLLAARFRSPSQIYLMLRQAEAERTPDLRRLLREIEQFLLQGETEFEASLQEQDWETLRPVLQSALWVLFPNYRSGAPTSDIGNDGPLHGLGETVIDDDLIGWTIRHYVMAGAFVVTIGLTIASFGASAPATIAALQGTMVALDVLTIGIDITLLVIENAERARANRYALLDHCLQVAEQPEDVTTAIAINLLTLLLPPIIARGGSSAIRGIRARLLRRALAEMPAEVVPGARVTAREVAEATTEVTERRAARPESGRPGAAERGVERPRSAAPADDTATRLREPEIGSEARGTAETAPTPASSAVDDLNLDAAFDDIFDYSLPPGATATGDAASAVLMVNREQQAILGNLLGRNWNDVAPRIIPGDLHLTVAQRAAWARADRQAREALIAIRRHWEAALPRGSSSIDDAARRVFARRPTTPPAEGYNSWFRSRLFGGWRQRAMRSIWSDTALRDQLREMGITIYWRPARAGRGRYVGAFRIRARGPDGRMIHVPLDVDHGVIGHSPAVSEAVSSGSWQPLVTTVDATNMQLLTARENQHVIEELRALAERWMSGS
jgi:hypothetical protein